jgi:hypothetical protein
MFGFLLMFLAFGFLFDPIFAVVDSLSGWDLIKRSTRLKEKMKVRNRIHPTGH